MNLMLTYRKIENRLSEAYRLTSQSGDLINLVKCRAIKLTKLHSLLSKRSQNSFLSASRKDALAVLLYEASSKRITDPLSLSPALALHILEDEFYEPEQGLNTRFAEAEQSMREWFAGYREQQQKSPSESSGLPELCWHDLPNELFGLMTRN
jgi:hypothetical protein